MPLFLRDFISTHLGTPHMAHAVIDSLMEKMVQTPPNVHDTATSEHYSAKYKALIAKPEYNLLHNKAMQGQLEYIVFNKSPRLASITQQISFCEQDLLPAELKVFMQAFIFEISDLGNCSHRSGYAALKLHEIFQASPIKVFVKSAEHVDQHVVCLGNEKMSYLVYDPLTNPELLFATEEYSETILTMFRAHQRLKSPTQVMITVNLREQYQHVATGLREMLSVDIDKFNVSDFIKIPQLQFSISEIFGPNAREILGNADKELKRKYGKGRLLSARHLEASETLRAPSQSIFSQRSHHDQLIFDLNKYLKQHPGEASDAFMTPIEKDRNYSLALRNACSWGNSELVKLLIQYSDKGLTIDFNQTSSNGKTPLVWFETSTASVLVKAEITALLNEKMEAGAATTAQPSP